MVLVAEAQLWRRRKRRSEMSRRRRKRKLSWLWRRRRRKRWWLWAGCGDEAVCREELTDCGDHEAEDRAEAVVRLW